MPEYVNVGHNNIIATSRIIAILTAGSLPCRRLVQHKRDTDKVLDATAGNRLKSVIVLDNDYIVLSGLNVKSVQGRLSVHNDRCIDQEVTSDSKQ